MGYEAIAPFGTRRRLAPSNAAYKHDEAVIKPEVSWPVS
jgi:hypothetical protein